MATKNKTPIAPLIDRYIEADGAFKSAEESKKDAGAALKALELEPAVYPSSDGVRGVRVATQERLDTGKGVERALAKLLAKKTITQEQFESCFETKLSAPRIKALAQSTPAVEQIVNSNTNEIQTLTVTLVKA